MIFRKLVPLIVAALLAPLASHAADVTIGALPSASALGGTEAVPLVQTGSCLAQGGTCQTPVNAFKTYILTEPNVTGLWTGTCSSSTFLRGDGACAAPPSSTGTVTSVALTTPAWLTVGGSPITSSGTFAITAATGQTANQFLGSPNGGSGAVSLRAIVAADLPSIDLTTKVTGILPGANGGSGNGFFSISGPTTSLKTYTFPNASATVLTSNALVTVPQGGIGVGTLTGIAKGNGTAAFTAAASSDVISTWSGTCSSSTYLRGDGSCASPAGAGTVTSVALTMPGIFSISGSPITSSGTFAVSATGTSGGIPYFSSGTALATSAALTAHGVVIGGGAATAPTSTAVGTAGQLLTSNGTGLDPTFQSGVALTSLPVSTGVAAADLLMDHSQADSQEEAPTVAQVGTAILGNGFLTFTGPTTSTKTITFPNASATALTTNAAVTVAQGGTGIASGTSGGVPYFSASTTIASSAALTANALVLGGGAGAAPAPMGSLGTTTTLLHGNAAGAPTFAAVSLTADVSGILPAANGGSGNGFFAVSGPATSTKTYTFPNASANVLTDNAAVTLAQGGLGITSGTSGGVPYFSASSTVASSAALTANSLVVGGGAGAAPTTTATINNGTVVIRVNPRLQTATDATSVTPTGDTADQTDQTNTQTTGTLTMNAPTGTPVDGQKWIFKIKSTNVQTFAWNAIYLGSTTAALPTTSTGSSKTDYFAFIYDTIASKWDFAASNVGF